MPVHRRSAALICALAILSTRPARAGELSDEEKRAVAFVDAHGAEAVAALKTVVDIPSATENLTGVRAVGKVFEDGFKAIGFETRWESMPASMKRAGHLIAEHRGTRGKRLLLIGHLDTVLEGRPFRRDPDHPGRALGNGTVDMKGGDVVILFALKALHDAGALEGRQIAVILTGDEEAAGYPIETSRRSIRDLARRSDVALAFEASEDAAATVARRGVASWTLKVKGRTGHSSGIFNPDAGVGAIYEASRILEGFRRELTGQRGLSVNVSLILGGTTITRAPGADGGTAEGKSNVIPGEVFAQGDLRFLSDAQCEAARKLMRGVVADSLPRTSAELVIEGEYPAMAETSGNHAVLAVLDGVSRDLGQGPIKPFDPVARGAGDISFVATFVDGLDGLGARGERSHTTEEWVDLTALPAQIQRAALLINRLTHSPRKDAPANDQE